VTLDSLNAIYEDARQECVEIFASAKRIGGRWRIACLPPQVSILDRNRAWSDIEIVGDPPLQPGERRVRWTFEAEIRSDRGELSVTAIVYSERTGKRIVTFANETITIPIDDPAHAVEAFLQPLGRRFVRLAAGREEPGP
jgi:hypothetical protein